jgi:hypothetical protein
MGYRIPKCTSVIPNLWVIGSDAENFQDPDQYRPERWLEKPDQKHSPFGFGRRLCPGRHVAHSRVSVVIAQLLSAYNFSHAYRDGKKVEVDAWDLILTAVVNSAPFDASLHLRSPKHQEIIEREWMAESKNRDKVLKEIRPPQE